MDDFIMLGDGREHDSQTILARGTYCALLSEARKYIMHHNKRIFYPKKRVEVKHMTDEQFWAQYDSAWLRCPNILPLPLK